MGDLDQLNWPVNAPPETETLQDENLLGSYASLSLLPGKKQRKTTFLQFRNWLATKIASGAMLLNPRSFTSGRFDSQELISGSLAVSGWYTIAEYDGLDIKGLSADFSCVFRGSTMSCKISADTLGVRTHLNTHVEITKESNSTVNNSITGFRIAKSDSVANAGIKVQAELSSVVTGNLLINIMQNVSEISFAGFELVAPYLDNTPTLPDGVTAGTFLEAGEELSFDRTTGDRVTNSWIAETISNDTMRCEVIWPEIPKQGTSITITLPATNLDFRNSTDTSAVLASFTISNFQIVGKRILFQINQVGIGTGTGNFVPRFARPSGAGCKLTIT